MLYALISLTGFGSLFVHAQTQESEEKLEAELPEVIQAEIIDTTRIVLEPRRRFNDPSEPQLIHAIALYAKERLWNLPPTSAPQKAVKPESPQLKNYLLHLTAYPSLPASLVYQVLFAGHMDGTRGFLHLNRQQYGDKRTEGRGDYNVDAFRAGLSHAYQPLSEIHLDVGLDLKDLQWLPAGTGEANPQKDLFRFHSNLNWKHQILETTWSTLNFDADVFRLEHAPSDERDEGTDLRLNFDMALSWPFLNPIHTGGHVEYFSATDGRFDRDAWATIFRLYIRDQFTPFGPFVVSMGAEGVSFRERDDAGEDQVRLHLNPSIGLTTTLSDHWISQLRGLRTTQRPKLSTLYFDEDYISLNPFLRPEKTWSAELLLKYHHGRALEVNLSGFAKQIDDLVVLTSQAEHFGRIGVQPADSMTELTWTPTNTNASIYGARFDISAHIADVLDLWFQYLHEFHSPDVGEHIPYRPEDLVDVNLAYHFPADFHVALGAEFRGTRHVSSGEILSANVDNEGDETLESYFLLKPKLSKTIANYVDVFVGGAFAIGEYRLLQDYELSQNNVDVGIEMRF